MRVLLLALALVSLAPLAWAQNASEPTPAPPTGVDVTVGGEPGIHVLINGHDVADSAEPRGAIAFDPSGAANVTLVLAPPPGTTWEIRSFRVGLVVSGPGSAPPASLTRGSETNTSIPPGYTVFINRTVDLAAFKAVGAGVFLMQVSVEDDHGGTLYAQQFYVHVKGNILLSAAGATVTVLSVATGYGLWQIIRDLKEFYGARQRHKKEEAARRNRAAALGHLMETGLDITGGLSGIMSAAAGKEQTASSLQKRRPVAWALTGFGLGGVGVSWAQFLGWIPLDVGRLLIVAATVGGVFLTASLLMVALVRRLQRGTGPVRSLTPESPTAREAPRAKP